MTGTSGSDTFVVDNAGDTITEGANQGTDTVQSSVTYTLGSNIENLTLTGYLHIGGNGNSLDNVITGNVGNNVLYGGQGADAIYGGAGNDVLQANDGAATPDGVADSLYGGTGDDQYDVTGSDGDLVVEQASEGTDTVLLQANAPQYTMTANVENLKVISTPYAYGVTLTGNALDNTITADPNRAGFIIDGGAGADTMVAGSLGGNTFCVDNAGDKVYIYMSMRRGGSFAPVIFASVGSTSMVIAGSLDTLPGLIMPG